MRWRGLSPQLPRQLPLTSDFCQSRPRKRCPRLQADPVRKPWRIGRLARLAQHVRPAICVHELVDLRQPALREVPGLCTESNTAAAPGLSSGSNPPDGNPLPRLLMSPSSSRTAVTSCSFVVTACRRAFQSATELLAGAAGMLSSWSRNSHIFCTEAAIAALLVSSASAWESCSGRGLQQLRGPQKQSVGAIYQGHHDDCRWDACL